MIHVDASSLPAAAKGVTRAGMHTVPLWRSYNDSSSLDSQAVIKCKLGEEECGEEGIGRAQPAGTVLACTSSFERFCRR